ncbi:MAG: hypothetical protein ACP5G1_03275 [Nanopusillaceae archaeon]
MILDRLNDIIKEDLEGEINIRGYNIKILREDDCKDILLSVNQIIKDNRFILQDLYPDLYPKTEYDIKNMLGGKIVDKIASEIFEIFSNINNYRIFYINFEERVKSILENIKNEAKNVNFDSNDIEEYVKLSMKIFSIYNLLNFVGFKFIKYSQENYCEINNIPVKLKFVPDLLFEYKGNIIIGDVKFGKYRREYKNLVTVYAFLYESCYKEDVNYGILIFIDKDYNPNLELFKLDDKIRSETINLIKEKYRSLCEEIKRIQQH